MARVRSCVIHLLVTLCLCAIPARVPAQAPEQEQKSSSDALEANPNRPSSSNSADVLARGVVQWEYGFSKEWGAAGDRQSTIGGELRFGVFRNVEFRWGGNPLVNNTSETGQRRGFGDQYFSGQLRLKEASGKTPALALSYAIKVPTASKSEGLGSGRVDHSFTFLVSKEIHKITCDFNAGYQLLGREGTSGHDQNGVFILTFQRTVYGPLSAIGEIGAETRLNEQTPALSTTLWALTYKVNRQVVVDVAVDVGITQGAPHKRILFGLTYAIANLYSRR